MRPSLIALFFFLAVALLGRGNQRGVDDLAGHGDIPRGPQRRVEAREQPLDRARLGELLAKQPDRAGVGNPVGERQAEEAHERHAIVDEKLGALVREIVHCLDDEDFEHHHRIEGRPSTLRAIGITERRDEIGAEHLEIDRRRKRLQMIPEPAQPLEPLVDVEKARLPAHRSASDPLSTRESETPRFGEVLRSVQLARRVPRRFQYIGV